MDCNPNITDDQNAQDAPGPCQPCTQACPALLCRTRVLQYEPCARCLGSMRLRAACRTRSRLSWCCRRVVCRVGCHRCYASDTGGKLADKVAVACTLVQVLGTADVVLTPAWRAPPIGAFQLKDPWRSRHALLCNARRGEHAIAAISQFVTHTSAWSCTLQNMRKNMPRQCALASTAAPQCAHSAGVFAA
jgi:hypothetical protein